MNLKKNVLFSAGVLLTDSASSNPQMTQTEAGIARAEGVNMLTIGIGDKINRGELRNIATTEQQMMYVPSYRQLDAILPQLRHMICDGT